MGRWRWGQTIVSIVVLAGCDGAGTEHAVSNSKEAYCALGSSSSLFLVDRTTPYDDTDRRVMQESIGAVIDGLGVGDRITLATIDAHYSQSSRLANDCKPGCPPKQGAFDAMVGGCSEMTADADLRNFKLGLFDGIKPLVTTVAEAQNSDIVATIAQWTQSPPAGEPFTDVYIFSDMLENSRALPWSKFKQLSVEEAIAQVDHFRMLPNVHAAAVRIVGFGRSHDPGRPPLEAELDLKLKTFWMDLFKKGGATTVTFEGAIRN